MEEKDGCEYYIFRNYKKKKVEGDYEEGKVAGNRGLSNGEAELFRSTLKGLGWKYQLTAAESRDAIQNNDKMADSVGAQMKNSQVSMDNMVKQAFKVLTLLESSNNADASRCAVDLKGAIRNLKKSINEYDDAVRFRTDANGSALTNKDALEILGRGAEALTECLNKAELGKAIGRIAVKKEKK